MDRLPIYEARLDDGACGMLRISLVDYPAVESDFMAFAEQKAHVMYAIADEEQHLVHGVVMRADFPIYRNDNGEYYIVYTAATIRQMAEKYLKEGRQNFVDLMHDGNDVEGVQMVQYYIKDSANGLAPTGFDDIADGSLFAEFHITSDDIWEAVKGGTFRGFSLEGVFALKPTSPKQKHSMSLIEKFAALFGMRFASVTTDKGILQWEGEGELPEVGAKVTVADEAGDPTAAPDGDYSLEDGTVISVADGAVTAVNVPEETPAEPEADVEGAEDEPAAEDEAPAEETPDYSALEARIAALEEQLAAILARLDAAEAAQEELGKQSAALSAHQQYRRKFGEASENVLDFSNLK